MLMRDVSCVVKLVMSKILLNKKAWNGNSVPQATTWSGWDLFGDRAFGFGLEPPPRSYGKFTVPVRRLIHFCAQHNLPQVVHAPLLSGCPVANVSCTGWC